MTVPSNPHTLAAYSRDSGGEAQELSISQQEDALKTWAATNGYVITQWFRDVARPGSSTVGRDGFQAMMTYFRKGAPESGVVVWSMSRFARDLNDAQFHRADLRRRGYTFLSINDPIPEGAIGKLFESILDWKNEQFLIDLSEDVRRGLSNLVRTYGAVPGTPPRGFMRQPVELPQRRDGSKHIAYRWAPDPEYIPRIKQAFEMRAAGKSLSEIHATTHLYKGLNCYGVTFFSNKLYIGTLVYGDLVIEHYCEPVIDQATWEAVRIMVKKHAAHINLREGDPLQIKRVHSTYLLSGLAFCARCGSPLFGAGSTQRNGHNYERYACTAAVRRRDCDLKPIPRAALEKAILDELRQGILQPDNVHMIQERLKILSSSEEEDRDRQRKDAQAKLATLRRRIDNTTNAIADAGPGRALTEKLKQLEIEEAEIMGNLAALDREKQVIPELSKDDIANRIAYSNSQIESADPEAIRRILHGLVKKIIVDREGESFIGEIIYYAPT